MSIDDEHTNTDIAHSDAPTPTSAAPTQRWPPVPPGKRRVFRPWRTLPDGTRIYAWQFGKRVFVWDEDV